MGTDEQLKDLVRQKYNEIALQEKSVNQASCCGSGSCSTEVYNIMSDDYTALEGYIPMRTSDLAAAFLHSLHVSNRAIQLLIWAVVRVTTVSLREPKRVLQAK
jgi:hypothetical protein